MPRSIVSPQALSDATPLFLSYGLCPSKRRGLELQRELSAYFDHIVTAHGDNTVIVRATSAIEFLTSNSVIGTGSMPLRPAR